MKKSKLTFILLLLFIAATFISAAQQDSKAARKQIINENQDALDAIAMYPTDIRKSILEASGYSEIIVQLSIMQKNTEADFAKLINGYSKEEQEKIWDLTRYPDLITELAANHRKSEQEINGILARYPEDIHNTARELGIKHYDLLVQIAQKNKNYGLEFEKLLKNYPDNVFSAFRELINLPDVLDILANHLQFTAIIGDAYKRNPAKVLHKTDSLNIVLTQRNAQETADWKQSMVDNPQAQQEYIEASQQFAQENGYQTDEYSSPLSPEVMNYNTNSYSIWFGYPNWYPYSYWSPYPYWYDWGFYYGPGRRVVFFGMPSHTFMNWYFYHAEHFYRYPELSNHYYNYYNKHLYSKHYNSISRGVNEWRDRNRDIVTSDWDKDDNHRSQRFKEFGNMEMNREKYNKANPSKPMDQRKFLRSNKKDYPVISTGLAKKQPVLQKSAIVPSNSTNKISVKNPAVRVPEYLRVTDKNQIISPNQNNTPVHISQPQVINEKSPVTTNRNPNSLPVTPNIQQEQKPANVQAKAIPQSLNQRNILKPQDNIAPITEKNNSTMPVVKPQMQPQRVESPVKVQTNTNQIRKAEEYHKSTWQQMPQQHSTPAPQVQHNSAPSQQSGKRK